MTSDLDEFLEWAKRVTAEEKERKAAKWKPAPAPQQIIPDLIKKRTEPTEVDMCAFCRSANDCKLDYVDLVFGKMSTKHGPAITECPHIADINEPLPDEPCWFCGKGDCDFYLTITHIDYVRPDLGYLLTVNSCLLNGSIVDEYMWRTKEHNRQIKVPIHLDCYCEYDKEE